MKHNVNNRVIITVAFINQFKYSFFETKKIVLYPDLGKYMDMIFLQYRSFICKIKIFKKPIKKICKIWRGVFYRTKVREEVKVTKHGDKEARAICDKARVSYNWRKSAVHISNVVKSVDKHDPLFNLFTAFNCNKCCWIVLK